MIRAGYDEEKVWHKTPRQIVAAVRIEAEAEERAFALDAKASLWGAQGDFKKTQRQLNEMIKSPQG